MLTLNPHVPYPTHAFQWPFTSIWLPFFRFHALLGEVRPNCMGHNTLCNNVIYKPQNSSEQQRNNISSDLVCIKLCATSISQDQFSKISLLCVLHIQTQKGGPNNIFIHLASHFNHYDLLCGPLLAGIYKCFRKKHITITKTVHMNIFWLG